MILGAQKAGKEKQDVRDAGNKHLTTMIMSTIMSLIVIATPAHDAIVRVALYPPVACTFLDA